jgi:hypothetical protein
MRDLKYSPYCALSVSSLADHVRFSFLEVIQIWMLSPWEKELHSDYIYEDVGNMDMMFTSLEETTSFDKYKYFSAKNLQVQIWSDECNTLSAESVRSEICVFINVPLICLEPIHEFLKHKKLINTT